MPADATAEMFRETLDAAFADPEVDSVIACFIPPLIAVDEEVADAVREAARGKDKPCLVTFLGMRGVDDGHSSVRGTGEGHSQSIPVYSMPEDAVRALAAATRYGQWRSRDRGTQVAPAGINRRIAEDIVETVLACGQAGAAARGR